MPLNPDYVIEMPRPNAIPYVDIFDKDSTEPVISMGVFLEMYSGEVFIKPDDLKWIAANRLGMVSAEDHEFVKNELITTNTRNVELIDQIEAKEEKEQEKFDARIDRMFDNYAISKLSDDERNPVPLSVAEHAELAVKALGQLSTAKRETKDFPPIGKK